MRRHKLFALFLALCVLLCGCSHFVWEDAQVQLAGEAQQPTEPSPTYEQAQEGDDDVLSVTSTSVAGEPQSYTKNLYGYTVKFTLPAQWVDAVTVEAGEEYICFIHTDSAAYGGMLMQFYFNDIGECEPTFVELGQIDGYAYGYVTPTDVQFDPSTAQEYEKLAAQIRIVAASFSVSGAQGDCDMVLEQTFSIGDYLVTFTLPDAWADCVVETSDTTISFHHGASMSCGGTLVTFFLHPIGQSDAQFQVMGQIDGFEYGYILPTDVQFPMEQQAAYQAMYDYVPDVVNFVYVR